MLSKSRLEPPHGNLIANVTRFGSAHNARETANTPRTDFPESKGRGRARVNGGDDKLYAPLSFAADVDN
ncbi:MAG: hypothetical protein ACK4X1_16680 [Terricaulis sp.]|jgi:hypothetical protein